MTLVLQDGSPRIKEWRFIRNWESVPGDEAAVGRSDIRGRVINVKLCFDHNALIPHHEKYS